MTCSLPSRNVTGVRPPATTDEELLGAQSAVVATEHTEGQRLARIHDEFAKGFAALAGGSPDPAASDGAASPTGVVASVTVASSGGASLAAASAASDSGFVRSSAMPRHVVHPPGPGWRARYPRAT